MSTATDVAPALRSATHTLATLRFGALEDELTTELRKLVRAVTAAEKAGTLTLTLKLKPGKAGQLEIEDDIKVKAPKPEAGTTLMFATQEGNLQREDPRQLQLPGIRQVDTGPAPIRNIG